MILKPFRLPEMEKFYLDAERQLIEFNNIVPLDKNPVSDVYSPRFLGIIQTTGSQIDSMFQIVTKQLGIKSKTKEFPSYYKALNHRGMLSFQRVSVKLNHSSVQPFKEKNPQWWNRYNKTKHDLPFGAYEVKLVHVLEALAGLFVLHDLAWTREICTDPAIDLPENYRKSDTFLDVKNWRDEEEDAKNNVYNDHSGTFGLKSQVFSRLTYFWPEETKTKK